MDTSNAFVGLDCMATGDRHGPDHVGRSDADAPLDPVYDLDAVDPGTLPTDPDSMWDYHALLPVHADDAVSAGEGATPLLDADDLAADLGVASVQLKDEGRNPTGSIFDRGQSAAVTMARAHGAGLLALAAPGDAGQSAAAYAGRSGTDCYAYLPSRAPFPNKAMVNVHGADMRVIGSLYQWDRSPRRVYEVREYDQRHNVAVGNWRETVPASELAEHPSVEDAMAAIRELRQDLEPDIAKARELRRRIRGIARQLDSDRAKAQDDILDEHVAPDLGNGRTVGEIVDDAIPDEIHPEEVDVEDAIEDVEPVDEDDQRHDNGDSLDEEDSPPNMADMEFYEAITDG